MTPASLLWKKRAIGVAVVLAIVFALIFIGFKLAGGDRSRKVEDFKQVERAATAYSSEVAQIREMMTQMALQTNSALTTLGQKIQQNEAEQKDLRQDIQRDTIRFSAPAPSADGKPVVINIPSATPGSAPAPIVLPGNVPQGVPVEIVREIIKSVDASRTEKTGSTDTQVEKVEKSTASAETSANKETETQKSTAAAETEKTIEKHTETEGPADAGGGKGSERDSRLGVGVFVTPKPQPFVALDLKKINLGLSKRLTVGKLGAGVFATAPLGNGLTMKNVDLGPQINYETRSGLSLYGAYGVRSGGTTYVGIGWKF